MKTKTKITEQQLKMMINEEIRRQLMAEARVIDIKQIAHEIVNEFFPVTGGIDTTEFRNGQQLNRFRREMEEQIAGAIKGVIRRHNRGQYVIRPVGSKGWPS